MHRKGRRTALYLQWLRTSSSKFRFPISNFRPLKASARIEYACLAMLHLAARHGAAEPAPIRDIAESSAIPRRFLVQILLQLKNAGLVASVRGVTGGYELARPPEEISLGEVVAVIEGSERRAANNAPRDSTARRVLAKIWQEAAAAQRQRLNSITLADLLRRVGGRVDDMYFI
jgi:Rrf2 family protein